MYSTDQRFTLNPKAVTIAPAGATTVQPAQPVTTPAPAPTPVAPPPPPPATVTITSDPAGADIEVDGTFIRQHADHASDGPRPPFLPSKEGIGHLDPHRPDPAGRHHHAERAAHRQEVTKALREWP